MQLTLTAFDPAWSQEVAGWACSTEEARNWAGQGLQAVPTASDIAVWHEDKDVHPYLLGDSDSKPVAYGEIWNDEDDREVELARLIVRPDRRNRGIGRQLVQSLVSEATHPAFDFAVMRVAPTNGIALACYRKCGFSEIAEEETLLFNRNQPIEYIWLRYPLNAEGA